LLVLATLIFAATPVHAAKKKPKPKPAPVTGPVAPASPAPQDVIVPPPLPAAKPTAPAPTIAPKPAEPKVIKASAPKDAFDFDLLDKPKEKTAADIQKADATERAGKLRRTMLLVHQALGFTLMGVSTVNFVLGVLNYYDKFSGGGFTNNYETAHLVSSMVTTGVFAGAGVLALFTPDPYDKPGRWDSARWHRIIMATATAGMVAQIVLGFVSAARLGSLDQRDLARTHLIIGTATYALTVAGGLTYLF